MEVSELFRFFLQSNGIVTDSRKIEPGKIFFALKGPNFNGNLFAKEALKKGALKAVVDEGEWALNEDYVLVEDGLKALQQLAVFHRQQLTIPVIGITGSNGKTTTKELISIVLSQKYATYSTKGNLNNHIGVPLSILDISDQTEIAVIEMGANHVGEIGFLSNIARPTHGIITNIGSAHLEGFGGIEGVKKGKGELYDFLSENGGIGFLNADERFLQQMANDRQNMRQEPFYQQKMDRVASEGVELIQESPYILGRFWDPENNCPIQFRSNLFGQYNFNNIMAAIRIGRFFDVPAKAIQSAIASYIPNNNRSQRLVYRGANILLDAYNANPTSMQNAINHLGGLRMGKKMAILGDMLELGDYSETAHREIAQLTIELKIDSVVLFGSEFRKIAKELHLIHFDDIHALKRWFETQPLKDFTVLIKGSRGMKLEKILDDL